MKCENCESGRHEYCLFDPPYNLCGCCTGKDYSPTIEDEIYGIAGS